MRDRAVKKVVYQKCRGEDPRTDGMKPFRHRRELLSNADLTAEAPTNIKQRSTIKSLTV